AATTVARSAKRRSSSTFAMASEVQFSAGSVTLLPHPRRDSSIGISCHRAANPGGAEGYERLQSAASEGAVLVCPGCGARNEPDARGCDWCGRPFVAEQRQITVTWLIPATVGAI